jgi:hypothetical protein
MELTPAPSSGCSEYPAGRIASDIVRYRSGVPPFEPPQKPLAEWATYPLRKAPQADLRVVIGRRLPERGFIPSAGR